MLKEHQALLESILAEEIKSELDKEIIQRLKDKVVEYNSEFVKFNFKSFYDENYLNSNGSTETSTDI